MYRQLAPSLVSKLLAFSKESGVTAFMSYLALFKVLLYRYSSQLDVCVGTPISGRLHQETEGLIGFFVNTLALRTHLREGSSYRELLAQVKQCCLEGYSHQGVPFEKVVEQVVQERDLSRHPLFQVLFTMDRLSDDQGIELPGVGVGEVAYSYNEIKFDLSLTVVEKGEETALVLEYCKDLYRRDTIDRMLDHYAHLLESVLDQPDEAIEHLPMLGEQEKLQLLEEFQGEQVDYPQDQTVLDLFAEQVERCGESEALVCGSSRMSYATLDAHSNQLAHYLVSQGVGPESLVGICIERSLEMIVGILGILKAGGAYVPIDPDYPGDRIGYILSDTGTSWVLSSRESRSSIPENYPGRVIELDGQWEQISSYPSTPLQASIHPDQLIYVIYTSGSTGRPKGVMIEHRNVVRLFRTDSPKFVFWGRRCLDLISFI